MRPQTAYRLALAVILALILYGSLVPLRFTAPHHPSGPLVQLLGSWPSHVGRRIAADMLLNILIYVPLGLFAYGAIKGRHAWRAAAVVLGLSTLLSASIEMLQAFIPSRNCSLLDVAMNAAGAAIGIGVAMLASGPIERFLPLVPLDAATCLGLWTIWQAAPFLPQPSLYAFMARLRVLAGARFSPTDCATAAACVLALGAVSEALAGARRAPWLLACALCLIPGKLLIYVRTTTAAELAGAAAGLALWAVVSKLRFRTMLAAAALAGAILFAGLRPYPGAQILPFSWIPFGVLTKVRHDTANVLSGKLFLYGTAVWLLRRGGWRYSTAGLSMAALLAAVEAAQTRLPGRTPEITDPLLALLLAGALYALQGRKTHFQPQGSLQHPAGETC